ncbi:hypothetical protein LOC68_19595 [Blastopirellula sp. JC732]|uniref:Uncharacterized protein n=1 Tax=Blastopirellula sediminis TaxID=2894196 RepID=A0A9X1MS40_9BACT|nr:hypothetical protein [Blastopirellula sediminis]MCC9606097.1 hypothetical protein [Blastopirellula sediminis]MCC9630604.1 hypothetical protein [Blastopirellula sediminis]
MLLNLQKWFGAVTLLGASFVTTSLVYADHAPHPTKPPKEQRDFIFRDLKKPPIPPKSSTMPRPFGLTSANSSAAKDAPKPGDPPSDWRKDCFGDYKPKPRPKPSLSTSQIGYSVPNNPAAKDAPKPTDPPSKWRKYIFEDYKAPKPRPKGQTSTLPVGLTGQQGSSAKDAPKPTDPPSDWRKYVFEDIKAPKPRPKGQVPSSNLPPVVGGKQKVGFPIPRSTPLPSHMPGGPGYPKDVKRPPYTHPPRDIKAPKGPQY